MVSNRFRLHVVIRTLIIGLTLFLFFYFLEKELNVSAVFFFVLFLFETYLLIHFVEKTNRDLSRFLNSIKFSDFSESFTEKNLGPSFKDLQSSFSNVMEQFKKTRSAMEEHFQYLQTTVKHVKIGLICFTDNGDIELLNDAARDLLGINELTNINNLNSVSQSLVAELNNIEAGGKALVKVILPASGKGEKNLQLSVAAAKFRMRGRKFTLVSLQDISSELERVRLQNELEIARKVQFKLLPKNDPEVPGYLIASRCIPALEVGGDYYDFIQLDNDRLGVVIGDVSGKGLPAAIYMTLTKGVFQSYASSSNSPREVLIKLNSLIYRSIERGSFVTMFYAILDFKNDRLIYSRAGHEPVIFHESSSDKFSILKPGGMGLGLEKGKIFAEALEEKEIKISRGDSFMFFTDGVTDFINPSLIADNKNDSAVDINFLISFIRRSNGKMPADLLDSISLEMKSLSNNVNQYDDMTMIAVKKV